MTMQSSKVEAAPPELLELSLAHSPDSDDAFMFYGLATRKIPAGHLRFSHVLEDIETLNRKALDGVYDITAISFHGYAYIADAYALLPCGASFGDRYGPIVVARWARRVKESIQHGLDHREEALAYAMQFSRGLDAATTDRFVTMYVNERTLRYGEEDRQAVQTLLDRGFARGLLPRQVKAEFVE